MTKKKYVHPLNRPVRKVDGELNHLKSLDYLVPDSQTKTADEQWAQDAFTGEMSDLSGGREGYVVIDISGERYFLEEGEVTDPNAIPGASAVYKYQGDSLQQMARKKQADYNEINQQMKDRGYQFMTSETDDGGVSYKLLDANPEDVGTLTQELGGTYEGYSFNYDPGQNGMSEFSINPSPQFRMEQTMPDMGAVDVTGDGMGMAPKGMGDADDAGAAGAGGAGVPTANDIPADAGAMYASKLEESKQAFNWPNMPGEDEEEDYFGEDYSQSLSDCPTCGEQNEPMGVLGDKTWYRCRACGMEYSPNEEQPVVAGWDEDNWDEDRSEFADPGGNSALRAESPSNQRNLPCPTCGQPNKLTPKDVAKGYQCDECADRDEGLGY